MVSRRLECGCGKGEGLGHWDAGIGRENRKGRACRTHHQSAVRVWGRGKGWGGTPPVMRGGGRTFSPCRPLLSPLLALSHPSPSPFPPSTGSWASTTPSPTSRPTPPSASPSPSRAPSTSSAPPPPTLARPPPASTWSAASSPPPSTAAAAPRASRPTRRCRGCKGRQGTRRLDGRPPDEAGVSPCSLAPAAAAAVASSPLLYPR